MNKRRERKDLLRVYSMTGKWLFPYCLSILITGIANPSIKVLFAFAYKKAVNAIEYRQIELFTTACIFVVLSIVIQCIIEPIANCYNGCKVNQIIYDIKKEVFKHVEKLPMSYYDKNHSGDVMSRLNSDMDNFEPIYRGNTRNIIQVIIYGLGSIVCMFLLDVKLTIICILLSAFSGITNSLFNRKLREVSDKKQQQVSTLLQSFMTLFDGINIAKIYQKSNVIYKKFTKENDLMQEIEIENKRINSEKETLTYLLNMLSKIGIFFIGLYFALQGKLDIGSVMSIIVLQEGISNMFVNLGGFMASMQGNLAGVRRIFELLEEKEEPVKYDIKAANSNNKNEFLVFEDVCFGYDEKQEVLHHINFNLYKDKMYAIVGTNGSGKSTLTKAMLGLYPTQGKINVMGKGFGEYDLEEIRSKIAYVDQNTALFNVSIYDNIRYGNLCATKEAIYEAAKKAQIHDFICSLEDGYETKVGDKGAFLSGGQRQRIILARAILKDAPIIILDEATASLDIENESQIFKTIRSISKDRVVIIIAHRLHAIQEADMIFVMDDGKIKEQGNHIQLMKNQNLYSNLYEMQMRIQS
jgi:ATP-binding cassette, subfamily B, bacterial